MQKTFRELTVEQDNLKKKEKLVMEVDLKLKEIQIQIKNLEEKKNTINKDNKKAYEEEVKKFNEEFKQKMNALSKKKRKETKKILAPDPDRKYTVCDECKENCHNPCDCWFTITTRCKIYPIIGKTCGKCGHSKNIHKNDYYHYIYIEEEVSENVTNEQNALTEQNEKEKEKIRKRIEEQNNETDSLQIQLNQLKYNKEDLLEERKQKEKEKDEVEKQVNNINKKMKITIMKLKSLSDEIYRKGMNKNHIKNENDYIDSLSAQMHEIGFKEEEIQKKLGEIKKNNELLKSVIKIPQEELLMENVDKLMDTYGEKNKK